MIVTVGLSAARREQFGIKEFPALVDTGAQVTLISVHAAAEVGLQGIGSLNLVLPEGEPVPTERFRASISLKYATPDIATSGQEIHSRPVTLPNAGLHPNKGRPLPYGVVLGMDFIKNFILHVDHSRFLFLPADYQGA